MRQLVVGRTPGGPQGGPPGPQPAPGRLALSRIAWISLAKNGSGGTRADQGVRPAGKGSGSGSRKHLPHLHPGRTETNRRNPHRHQNRRGDQQCRCEPRRAALLDNRPSKLAPHGGEIDLRGFRRRCAKQDPVVFQAIGKLRASGADSKMLLHHADLGAVEGPVQVLRDSLFER